LAEEAGFEPAVKANVLELFKTMRATIKIVVFNDKTAAGKLPVKLRVTYARKVRYFPLNRYVSPEFWDRSAGRFMRGYTDWRDENEVLVTYEQRAMSAIRGFELDGAAFTFDKFEAIVFGASDQVRLSAADFVRSISAELDATGNVGNSEVYKHCANSVAAFRPKAALADIDGPWLVAFEKWMRTRRGTESGGISVIMRTLRASCKRAAKSGVMPKTFQPFSDYSLKHLKGDNAKKALPLEVIMKIASAEIPRRLEFARDVFMLSFYLRGMNLADLAEIKRGSIRDGRVLYRRKKTKGLFSVPLVEPAAAILARYEHADSEYLLPIFLSGIHVTERQKMYRKKRVTKEVNAAIREVAEVIGVDTENFTFYTARHSYATALDLKGVSRVIISQALGHKSLSTTEGYLKGFSEKEVDEFDRLILDGFDGSELGV